jgi:hypothetical protein
MDLVSSISRSDKRLNRTMLRNQISWSEIMVFVIQKCTHTHSKKILAVAYVVMFFL